MTIKPKNKGGRPRAKPLNQKALEKAKKSIKKGNIRKSIKGKTKEKYETFVEYCNLVGIMNVSPAKYARENNMNYSTIHQWKKFFLEDYDLNLKVLSKNVASQTEAVIKRLASLAYSKDPKVSVAASKAFIDAVEKMATVLERYGFKSETKSHDEKVVVFNIGVDKLDYPVLDYDLKKVEGEEVD